MQGQQGQPGAGAPAGGDGSGGGVNANAAAMLRLLAGLQRQQQQQQQPAGSPQTALAGGVPGVPAGPLGPGPSAGGTLAPWAPPAAQQPAQQQQAQLQPPQQAQVQQAPAQQQQQPQPDAASALLALLAGVQQQQLQPPPPPPPAASLGGLAGLLAQLLPQPQLQPSVPLMQLVPQQLDANLLLALLQLFIQAGGGAVQQQAAAAAGAFAPALPALAPQIPQLWQQPAPLPQAQPAALAAGGSSDRALEALRWLKQFEGASGLVPAAPAAATAAPDPTDCTVTTATASDRGVAGVPNSGSTVEGDGKRLGLPPLSGVAPPAKRQRGSAEQLIFGPAATAPTIHPARMLEDLNSMGVSAPAQPSTLAPHVPAQQLQLQAQAPQAQLLAPTLPQLQAMQAAIEQQLQQRPPSQQQQEQQVQQHEQQQEQQEQQQLGVVPPQLEPQMAAAAATLAAAMAGQHSSPAAGQALSGQVPLETLLAQANDSHHTLEVPALHVPPLPAASPTTAGVHANPAVRHSNQGYGVAVTAPEGLRRGDMVALHRQPQERVERQITNQTYILRLHVTTQMAQLLFPPRGELEAAHQAAVALDPPPPHASRLGGSSTYTQLFKQRLTIVDESDRAWPVQYEGFLSSGQRHYRLTSGWVGLMRAQQVGIGDTLVLERWTEDRWVIHLHIRRKASAATEASAASAAAAAAAPGNGQAASPQVASPAQQQPQAQAQQAQLQQDLLAQALAAVMQPSQPAAGTPRLVPAQPPVILKTEGMQASAQASMPPAAAGAQPQPQPQDESAEAEAPSAPSDQPTGPTGASESVESAEKQAGEELTGSETAAEAAPEPATGGGGPSAAPPEAQQEP